MNRSGRRWYSWMAEKAVRLRVDRPDAKEMRRRARSMSFETQTSRWPLRMTERLRDRLRRRWIKLKS